MEENFINSKITFPKLMVFDLDGTLLDTVNDLGNCINQVLLQFGYPINPIEKYKEIIGRGSYETIKASLPYGVSTLEVQNIVECYKSHHCKITLSKTYKYDGVDDLLSWLEINDIRYAVLSNKPMALAQDVVRNFFPNGSFFCVIGHSDKIPPKPHTAGVLSIIKNLGINPSESILLGDSGVDMETAKNAGMVALGALWGYKTIDELLQSGADAIIEKPSDAIDFLTNTYFSFIIKKM